MSESSEVKSFIKYTDSESSESENSGSDHSSLFSEEDNDCQYIRHRRCDHKWIECFAEYCIKNKASFEFQYDQKVLGSFLINFEEPITKSGLLNGFCFNSNRQYDADTNIVTGPLPVWCGINSLFVTSVQTTRRITSLWVDGKALIQGLARNVSRMRKRIVHDVFDVDYTESNAFSHRTRP